MSSIAPHLQQGLSAALRDTEELMQSLIRGEAPDLLSMALEEHFQSGGKRLRARLVLAACRDLGFDPAIGIGWAAACELLHNATLIHDDIQDEDRVRRKQPTVWVRHGVAQAINAGDLLFVLPFRALQTYSPEINQALVILLAQTAETVIRGQSQEQRLLSQDVLTPEAYCQAIAGKTAALFAAPVQGALVLTKNQLLETNHIFSTLGMLFQIQDDLVDLYGDKGRGEPGSDLKEGKVSALVVQHLQHHAEDRLLLCSLLQKPREEVTRADIEYWMERFRQTGTVHATEHWMKTLLESAQPVPQVLQALAKALRETILQPREQSTLQKTTYRNAQSS